MTDHFLACLFDYSVFNDPSVVETANNVAESINIADRVPSNVQFGDYNANGITLQWNSPDLNKQYVYDIEVEVNGEPID